VLSVQNCRGIGLMMQAVEQGDAPVGALKLKIPEAGFSSSMCAPQVIAGVRQTERDE
jgi:hypothetical protein